MLNDYATKCVSIMQQIDVDSQRLTPEDHTHIEECSNCCSYFEADQEIMSQLEQCLTIKVPDTLHSDMIKMFEQIDANQSHKQQRNGQQQDNQPQKNRFISELMTCAACITLVFSSLMLIMLNMTPLLEKTIIGHLEHQHEVHYNGNISSETVTQLLGPYDMNIDNMISKVVFANECTINGEKSAHVIYLMNKKPVSIIAMPIDTPKGEVKQIDDQEYQGMIVGIDNGTIVIASKDKAAVSDIYKKLKGSLTAI